MAGLTEAQRRREAAMTEPWGDPSVRARYDATEVGGSLAAIYRECVEDPAVTRSGPRATVPQ
jgi:hypothetical protein